MIAILKYSAGNTMSVKNAVRRLGYICIVTDDPDTLKNADKVIFPGVGSAAPAMAYLKEKGLDETIKSLRQPVLGICLGMQLMCNATEEGNTQGLGIFDAVVQRFPPGERVPHMGWNNLAVLQLPLFEGITALDDVYFVHSYYASLSAQSTAICDYILPFSAALQKNNFYGVQFHPEKSGEVGSRILKNFLQL